MMNAVAKNTCCLTVLSGLRTNATAEMATNVATQYASRKRYSRLYAWTGVFICSACRILPSEADENRAAIDHLRALTSAPAGPPQAHEKE